MQPGQFSEEMLTNQHDEASLLEDAIPLDPSRLGLVALQIAQNSAVDGIVSSTYNMPLIKRLLYPEPCERKVLSCCFTSLCLFTMGGSITGCAVEGLHNVIATPEIMKAIFTFPALIGWLMGCCCSAVGMCHYRYELEPRQITPGLMPPLRFSVRSILGGDMINENPIMGTPLQQHADQADQLTRDNARADESIRVGVLEEPPAEIRSDIRVRPIGYAPPVIPSPRQML